MEAHRPRKHQQCTLLKCRNLRSCPKMPHGGTSSGEANGGFSGHPCTCDNGHSQTVQLYSQRLEGPLLARCTAHVSKSRKLLEQQKSNPLFCTRAHLFIFAWICSNDLLHLLTAFITEVSRIVCDFKIQIPTVQFLRLTNKITKSK